MSIVSGKVKRWGNSLAFVIPAQKAKSLHLWEGKIIGADIFLQKRVDAFGILGKAKAFEEEKETHNEFW